LGYLNDCFNITYKLKKLKERRNVFMANKTFETRIQLKYDSYANWTANNPTPLSGEVCIVVIPAETGAVVQEPSILFKVGDGSTAFNSLPYVSAVAADVYDWAKAAAKPSYTADEISGLADYIAGEIQDTNTQYKLEQDTSDTHILKLYKKDLADADWNLVTTITTADTVYDDTALAGRVTNVESRATALEGLVGSVAVATQIANAIAALDLANTYDAKGTAAQALTDAKTYADGLVAGLDVTDTAVDGQYVESVSEVDGKVVVTRKALPDYSETYEAKGAAKAVQGETTSTVKDVEDAVDAIKDGTTIDSFADVETALAGKQPTGDYATKAEAQGYADAKDAAIAAAKKAGDDAQADVDALEAKVGTVPADKTVVEMISDAQAAATYDDTQVKADIKANADAIDVLNGTGAGSVDKKITDAFNDFATKVTDDGVVNSYKELIDWAATHGAEAAEMAGAITALQNILAGIGGEGESTTVVAYVQAAIDALKIGDYAKAADLTALAERVTTVETEVAKKANDADLAAVAKSGKVEDLAQDGYIIFNCGSSSTVI
jgi:hypothetical protein